MGGHRNTFENNEVLDNGNNKKGYGVRILGETHDLTFTNNRIGNAETTAQRVGVHIGEKADRVHLTENDLSGNLDSEIEDAREKVSV